MPRVPAWAGIWIGGSVLFLLLRVGGAIRSVPLTVYLIVALGPFCWTVAAVARGYGTRPTLLLRRITLGLLIVGIPPLMDPSTVEVSNLPRLFLVCLGAAVVVGTWVVDGAWTGRRPRFANGMQWAFLAVLAWTALTTVTSALPRVSLLGAYGSYEGLELMTALVILAFAFGDSFSTADLSLLLRLLVVGSCPVLVYALIQMHGFVLGGDWDFTAWKNGFHNVFATYGNPNHFAGYLATTLPTAVVLAVRDPSRHWRLAMTTTAGVTLVVIVQTAARGAWLGTLLAGLVLVTGLWSRDFLRPRVVAGGAVAVVGAGLILILGAHRFIGGKLSSLFTAGGNSSISQRFGYWQAALRIVEHHRVFGTGPDTYSVFYARYQTASLARAIQTQVVNGPHNLFMDFLANQGVVGLIALVVLFLCAFVLLVIVWKVYRLGPAPGARGQVPTPSVQSGELEMRAAVVAVLAGVTAYVVQACFDVSQVGTLFYLWVLLGMAGVLAAGTWAPARLVRFPFGRLQAPVERRAPEEVTARVLSLDRTRRRSRRARASLLPAPAIGTMLATVVFVAVVGWRLDLPWRADHQIWAAGETSSAVVGHATQGQDDKVTTELMAAIHLNPWQPSYYQEIGQLAFETYQHAKAGSTTQIQSLNEALSFYGQALTLDGYDSSAESGYGAVLLTVAELERASVRPEAITHLRAALRDDPYNLQAATLLRDVLAGRNPRVNFAGG